MNDAKFDIMMNNMERLMDRMTLDNKPPNREQPKNQIRNPNFRRPPPSQGNQRNPDDQQITPPFLENLVDGGEEEEDPMDHHFHQFDDVNAEIYLTEEEHNLFDHDDESTISVTDSVQYLRGYQNSIDDV